MVERLVLFLGVFFPSFVVANELHHFTTVDDQSFIEFEAIQNNAPVKGQFKKIAVDVHFHPENLEESSVKAEVDINSIFTDHGEVESTLKTEEWLHNDEFPKAVFKSTKFEKIDDATYKALGGLTLKGHEEVIELIFSLDDFSKEKAQITGKVTLLRNLFGVGWKSTDSVKDDVHVTLKLTVKP